MAERGEPNSVFLDAAVRPSVDKSPDESSLNEFDSRPSSEDMWIAERVAGEKLRSGRLSSPPFDACLEALDVELCSPLSRHLVVTPRCRPLVALCPSSVK